MTRWILGHFSSSVLTCPGHDRSALLHTVINNGDGTFDAVFGTLNTNATAQTISFGGVRISLHPVRHFADSRPSSRPDRRIRRLTVLFDGTPLTVVARRRRR